MHIMNESTVILGLVAASSTFNRGSFTTKTNIKNIKLKILTIAVAPLIWLWGKYEFHT